MDFETIEKIITALPKEAQKPWLMELKRLLKNRIKIENDETEFLNNLEKEMKLSVVG